MDVFDVKGTRALTQLDGGDLAIAADAEVRREAAQSATSTLLLSDNILGDPTPGDAQFANNSRRVWAIFSELNARATKELEFQLALRRDHYDVVSATTNPKIGLRYVPFKQLLLRASAGTGFRAPSLNDLYRSVKTGSTATLPAPVCRAENGNDRGYCADNFTTRSYANAKLKPERSQQFSLDLVFEPLPHPQLSVDLDYWNIEKSDLISMIGDDVILSNLPKYGLLVHRYNQDQSLVGCPFDAANSAICFIELQKENRGKQRASGLDLDLDLDLTLEKKPVNTSLGQFGARLLGTLALTSENQTGFGDDFVSDLRKCVSTGVVQRWRHRLTLDWAHGPVSLALTHSFYSGYTDQNSAIDTNAGTVVAPNTVKAYSLWDLSCGRSVNKALTLRATVKNILNTAPPFSNQTYFLSPATIPATSTSTAILPISVRNISLR